MEEAVTELDEGVFESEGESPPILIADLVVVWLVGGGGGGVVGGVGCGCGCFGRMGMGMWRLGSRIGVIATGKGHISRIPV